MKLSFIIPSYNCADTIAVAVKSCLMQTYKDIEVVIVDDGSTDSTPDYLAWLEKQAHPNVQIVRHLKNEGRSHARNTGNLHASGDVICVLDADDTNTLDRAKITAAKFKAGAVFVHGGADVMDAVGKKLGVEHTDVFNKAKALETGLNGIVHSTVAYTKDLAMKYPYAGGEIARLGLDDWEFQIRLAMDGVKFDYTPSILASYRMGDGVSTTRDPEEVKKFKGGYLSALKVNA